MRRFLPHFLLCTTLALASVSARADEVRTLSVSGLGEVFAVPDMATITVGVQTEAESAAQALDEASEATLAILAHLEAEGIAPTDIQTGTVRLQPRYSSSALSSGQKIVGYGAINSVDVQVTDLDLLGGLLSAVVGDGANRLDRVAFGLQDPSAAMDEARRLAVAEAIRRADLYATAAGVRIGDVLSISEQGGPAYQAYRAEPVMMEAMAASPAFDVPLAAGEINLTATINMAFEIAP